MKTFHSPNPDHRIDHPSEKDNSELFPCMSCGYEMGSEKFLERDGFCKKCLALYEEMKDRATRSSWTKDDYNPD